MSLETHTLGLIAGGTIVFGLPVGRLGGLRPERRQFLNAFAIGVLIFLLWDVLGHAWEPVDGALAALHEDAGGARPVVGYASLFLGGFAAGLLSLVYYERWLEDRSRGAGATGLIASISDWSPARRLALMIAVGIGLHNFGEGLAIGNSAASGELSLATVLVIGFALHNATEGFGIVAPLGADAERPGWGFLAAMGAIGGAPTFVGTIAGSQFTSETVSVLFLTLAAGSILYVVVQLLRVAQANKVRDELLYWGIFAGLVAGFVTDMIVTAGGA